MKLQTDRRGTQEYIEKVMASNYVQSGAWFPTSYLQQQLFGGGFHTTTKKVGDICNVLVDDGLLEKYVDRDQKGMVSYRKRVHGREYLSKAWRKHTDAELGIEELVSWR